MYLIYSTVGTNLTHISNVSKIFVFNPFIDQKRNIHYLVLFFISKFYITTLNVSIYHSKIL